jgi:LmbE family N-acetylglucosaminyl deacetylase
VSASIAGRAVARLAALLALRAAAAHAGVADPAALPQLGPATSLLVVAPHPDDETLCCAGVIQRVLRAGGRAAVVWITSGDGSALDLLLIEHSLLPSREKLRDLAQRRMSEARRAAALLGVPPAGQLFLGYPDGGLERLLAEHRTEPYTSRFTGAAAVPYPAALFPGHPYTGTSLESDFAAVLARLQPNLILAPSVRDTHADHRATGRLASTVSARFAPGASLHFWIVHGGEGWPSPRELLPGVPLSPAPRSRGLALGVFALEPAEEDRQLDALRAYATQLRTSAPFLLAFVRSTELFAAAPGPPPSE